jgi:PAS domain S-box-containing protein
MKDKILISSTIRHFLQIWSWIGILIVLILSILDIIGWIFNFPRLTGFSLYYTPMRPITAISFLLCSASFISLAVELKGKIQNLIMKLSAIIVGLIGLLTIISYFGYYITGKEMVMTTTLFLELFLGPAFRMALMTACSFLIIGIVFFLLSMRKPQAVSVAHGLILFPMSVGYLVLLSYVLHVYHIHEILDVAVALNTGITLLLLCIALLFLNPGSWIMNKFTGNYSGSLMARRLLPGVILLPVIIGWLRIQGEQHGLYSSEVGVTLVALTYTCCFLAFVWLTAFSVNRSDKELVRNEALLREAQRIARIGSWEWYVQTGRIFWSDEMYRIFGEVKGKFIPTYENFVLHVHPDDRQQMEDAVKETIEKDIPFKIEYRILTKTAGEFFVAAHADVLRNENNEVQLFIGTVLDISDRKKYEEALQASRESLSTTLASIGDAVIATDIKGDITFLNRVGEELTGWNYEDAVGKPANEVFHIINEQSRLKIENPVQKVLKNGTSAGMANHTILVRKDGTEIPIEDSGAPILGKSGQISGVVLVFRDITERKRVEKQIHESEQRLRFHFENSPLGVVEWDSSYRVTQWSKEAERLFGYDAQEVIGKPIVALNLIVEEDIPIVESTIKQLSSGVAKTVVSTNRNYTKEGKIIECTWFNTVLIDEEGAMSSVMSLVMDITEQKRTQEEIRQSKEFLEKIFNYSNAPFICWAPDNRITRFNHAFERMTGYQAEEVLDKDLSFLFPDESKEESLGKIEKTLSGEFWADVEIPILRKDGDIRLALWNSANIYSDDGTTLITTIAQGQDITERKKAEQALADSEHRFHLALKNAPVSVAMQDKDLIYRWAYNQKSWKTDEIVGKTDADLFSKEDLEWIIPLKQNLLKTGNEMHVANWLTSNGKRFFLDISYEAVKDASGEIAGIGMATVDLTERKLIEDALQESEKKYRELIKYAPTGIYEIDFRSKKFVTVNDAMSVMSGYSKEELLSMDAMNILVKESRKLFMSRLNQMVKGEMPVENVEYKIRRKDGQIRDILLNLKFNFNEKALPTGAFCIGHDITERKLAEVALRNSQERFKSVLDSSLDVIYRLNLVTGKYEYFSPASKEVFGFTAEEFMQMDVGTATSRIHPDDIPRIIEILAKVNDLGIGKLDYRFKKKNGQYCWISNHMSLVRDNEGRPMYRDGNIRDITDLKRYQEEIIAANEELTLFNSAMVGRELRMIDLKNEINQLCSRLNQPPIYEIENEEVLS